MPSTPKDDSKVSKPASESKTRKIVDVAAPGKSAPSASGKAIIVSNRPILKRDPMMAAPGIVAEHPDMVPVSRVAKTIKVGTVDPLTDEQKAADTSPAETANTSANTAAKPTAPTIADLMNKKIAVKAADDEPKPEPKTAQDVGAEAVGSVITEPGKTEGANAAAKPAEPASSVPEKPEELPAKTPIANDSVPSGDRDVDGVDSDGDGQLAPNQIVDQAKRKEASEQTSKLAEQEKVIDSQQFFLPITDHEKRKGMEFTLLVLVIVLALTIVWFDLMLDAGILHISGLQSFTHFFSQ